MSLFATPNPLLVPPLRAATSLDTLAPRSPLALTTNPIFASEAGNRPVGLIEQELKHKPHLRADARQARREAKAVMSDARGAKTAAEALGGRLPEADEGIHMVISGRFALFDYIPAVLRIAGCRIDALAIATLGFSARNIAKLVELVEANQIGTVQLLASHYFAGTSASIYEIAAEEFGKRPDRMKFLSVRSHAKLIAAAMADGRRVTFESSANLRSCKNIETCSAFGSPDLYEFHLGWIQGLFNEANAAKPASRRSFSGR